MFFRNDTSREQVGTGKQENPAISTIKLFWLVEKKIPISFHAYAIFRNKWTE